MKLIILTTLICLCATFPAQGSDVKSGTGYFLLDSCKKAMNEVPDNSGIGYYCIGKIGGMLAAFRYYDVGEKNKDSHLVCLPKETVSVGQGIMIVNKYLNDNLSLLHEKDDGLVFKALRLSYPCR